MTRSVLPTVHDFYVGDIVEVTPSFYTEWVPTDDRTFVVLSVSTDGRTVGSLEHSKHGYRMFNILDSRQLRLVRRGNMFRYTFNMGPLEFTSLSDEATFWLGLHQAHEVPNRLSGSYFTWTGSEAVDALHSGTIDAFFVLKQPSEFYGIAIGRAYVFNDPAIGERMRITMLDDIERYVPVDYVPVPFM